MFEFVLPRRRNQCLFIGLKAVRYAGLSYKDRRWRCQAPLPRQGLAQGADLSWHWRYYGIPQEGLDIELGVDSLEPVAMRLLATTWRWPQELLATMPIKPATIMPRPHSLSDSTIVVADYRLE